MKTLYILTIMLAHSDPHYVHVSGFTSLEACQRVSAQLDAELTKAGEKPVHLACEPIATVERAP